MPVVAVTGPALGESATIEALRDLAGVIGSALSLAPSDVYVGFMAAGPAVLGLENVRPWPIVVLHGRARDPASMSAAADAARSSAARSWSCEPESVWVQWLTA